MGVHILKSPLNLKAKDKRVFQHEGFGFPELNLFNLQNVTITADGICLINQEIVRESIHHHRDRMELYYLMTNDIYQDETTQLNDSQPYLIIHGPALTIYHWITESIPRLWMIRKNIQSLTLLLPYEIKGTMLEQMLWPFRPASIHYLSQQENVHVQRLALPELKPLFPIFDPNLVTQIREFYFSRFHTSPQNKKRHPKKIYLRLNTHEKNKIHNTDDIEALLKKMDFELLDVTKLNFVECLERLSHADFIISTDCDDLALMQFMRPGISLLELRYNHGNDVDLYLNRFWHFASCLEINYYYQFGAHTSYDALDHLTKGFRFDLTLLESNIQKMLDRNI